MSRKKIKVKQQDSFSEFGSSLENFIVGHEEHYLSIVGIRLVTDVDLILKNVQEYPSQRTLFLAEEGTVLCLSVQTNLEYDEFLRLWNEQHELTFSICRKNVVKINQFEVIQGKDERIVILSTEVDWNDFLKMDQWCGTFELSIGKQNLLTEVKKCYILSASHRPEVYTSDFYFLAGDSSSVGEYKMQTGFDKKEDQFMTVCYGCRYSNVPEFADIEALEVEFRLTDAYGKLINTYISRIESVEGNQEGMSSQEFFIGMLEKGDYRVEVHVFGDKIAEAGLTVGKKMNGKPRFKDIRTLRAVRTAEGGSLTRINELVGLQCVKRDLRMKINYMRLMAARKAVGLPVTERLMHTVMVGNPGTGKTTVARLMASALHEIGLLTKGHLVECNRENLTDSYIGGTEKKTREMIDMAKGGVMFIDEAYSLFEEGSSSKDFGRKVIDTLMPVLSNPNSDLIVIMAGYEKEMDRLLDSNPGLSSRFPVRLKFEDYSVDELMAIARLFFLKNHYQVDENVMIEIRKVISLAKPIEGFGNGRFVYTLIENFILPTMGERLYKQLNMGAVDSNILSVIFKEDVPNANEILDMVGLRHMKNRIGFR